MKPLKSVLLMTVLFSLCAAAHAAVVGRVLVAAGESSIIRNKQELRVTAGFPVEDQDTLKTGPFSNMQIRFNDESVVSLRDHSLLRIDEFKFTGKQDGTEKAFFNLLKGGFRTITGLIGRVNKTNYGVKTATATIGIRGTNFALLHCIGGNCGAAAKDGLYGGVNGGIIAATNKTGEYQFGSGDYFFIPSEDTPAKKLIRPPEFFADHLTGQGRVEGRLASLGNERPHKGGADSDSRPNRLMQAPPPKVFIVTEELCGDGFPCVLSPSSFTPNSPAVLPSAGSNALEVAWTSTGVSDVAQAIEPNDFIRLLGSQMTAYCVPSCNPDIFPPPPGTLHQGNLVSGTVTDQGSESVGNMFWGRWVPDSTTFVTGVSGAISPPAGAVYIFGALATSVPTTGTAVTFAFAGGPGPVDASGNVGSITNGGSLLVNFVSRSVTMASPLQFNTGPGGVSYNMGTLAANYPSATQPQITGTLSGSCIGGACSATAAASGPVSAHFTGATGAGLGIGLATVVSSPAPDVALAAGYKCATC